MYQFTPVAKQPISPEIVFIPRASGFRGLETVGILASWNHLWEAAQYRKQAFRRTQLKEYFGEFGGWLERLPEVNIYLVAETKTRYDAYAPLYHLLPKRLLDRHALPALKRTVWPVNATGAWNDEVLPADFINRLSSAFGEHVWRYLDSGSGMRAFSSTEPLVVLSHNLDFWLPHAITAIEKRMRTFGRAKVETANQRKILTQAKEHHDPEVALERPRKGGILWMGEGEAASVTREIVDAADREGRLQALIDAVKSNRVVDDFSSRWSFAREDFERKLYAKRSKVRVSFVELRDTLPVHSARTEYTDSLIWEDFTALLDARERHVVVCLRNGTTKLRDIAKSLGYANHSPISKALARIRKKASQFLSLH